MNSQRPLYYLKFCISLFLFLFLSKNLFAATFNDAANGDWNVGLTWGGLCAAACVAGTDYPGAADTATVNSHTVTLTQDESATTFTKSTAGVLALSTFKLTVSGTALLSGGTVTNGANGEIEAGGLVLSGATFSNDIILEKTAIGTSSGAGGCTFSGNPTIINSSNALLQLGQTNPDTFNGVLTLTVATNPGRIEVARASSGTLFNENIVVNNTSAGIISFGDIGGTSTLANGKTITIGGSGFSGGTLHFEGFTQTGSTAQSLTLTGTAILEIYNGTTFNGNVTFTSPRIDLGDGGTGPTFNGTATLEKNGATNDSGSGGCVFNSTTIITNSSTATLRLANAIGDTYNGNVTFVKSGSGVFDPARAGTTSFAGNVTLDNQSGTIVFNGNGGTIDFTKTSGTQTFDSDGSTVLNLAHSGAGTLQLTASNLTVNTTLTNSSGTFDLNGLNLTTTGATFTNSATIKLQGGETVGSVAPTNNSGSTVIYSATSGSRAIKDWTYHHLTIEGANGTFTSDANETLGGNLTVSAGTFDISTGSRTFEIDGTLTMNGGTLTATSATINADGNVTLTTGTLTAPNGDRFTVAGAWSKAQAATFTHSSGTVNFDGANQSITGSTTWSGLKKTDPSDDTTDLTLTFDNTATQTIAGTLTLTGIDTDDRINLVSDSPTNRWEMAGTSYAVTWAEVTDSDNSTGTTASHTNTISGGNNLNWGFGITISGTVYTNEAQSTNVGSGITMGLSINGGAKTNVDTTAGGAFSFTTITVAANNTILLFIDDESSEANFISQANDATSSISTAMYTNKIVLAHETSDSMTNTLLATADGSADDDIHYTISGVNVDFEDGYEVWVNSGETYTPGGAVEADDLEVEGTGTFNPVANAVTIHGGWKVSSTGSFTSSGTVTFDAASGSETIITGGTDPSHDFQNLTKSGGGTLQLTTDSIDINDTITISSSTTVDLNSLNITAGTLDNTGTLLLDGGETVTITTFDSNTGTVKYEGTSSVTIPSSISAYYNLTFDESGTSDPTYTLPDTSMTVNGVLNVTDGTLAFDNDKNLTINEQGSTGTALTVASGGALSNSGTGDFQLAAAVSNSGTITFNASGASDDIAITSSASSSQRNWQGSGIFSMTDVAVSDQGCVGGTPNAITVNSGTDNGRNTNWLFSGSSLSSVSVIPASLTASASTTATIAFTTTNAISSDGRIQITFPSGFTVSGVSSASSASDLNGSLAVSVSGQVVTITRSGGTNLAAGGTVDDLILSSITNPSTAGLTGTFAVETQNSSATTIDSGTGSGVTIQSASSTTLVDSNSASADNYIIGSATVGRIYISISDSDENTDASTQQTISGTVTSSGVSDSESVTLTETGVNTGIFSNASTGLAFVIGGDALNNNESLGTQSGATVTAAYTDNDDSTDTSQDTATIQSADTIFDLSATVIGAGSAKPGEILSGLITLKNKTQSTMQNTDVMLSLPSGVSFLDNSVSSSGNIQVASVNSQTKPIVIRILSVAGETEATVGFKLSLGLNATPGDSLKMSVYTENN